MHVINLYHLIVHNPVAPHRNNEKTAEYIRKEHLVPALEKHPQVFINLDGYNRYNRSFLIELFVPLLIEHEFEYEDLKKRLFYDHSMLRSFKVLVDEMLNRKAIRIKRGL